MPDAFMLSEQAEFGASALTSYAEQDMAVESWDLIMNELAIDYSWCSTLPAAPTLTAGSVDMHVCFDWDGSTNEVPFNPITVAACTDPGIILSYQADLTATSFDPLELKLTIDPISNVIRYTGLSTGSTTGSQTITVTGTLPDRVTESSFTFTIEYSPCLHQVFTAPTTATDQVYYVTNAYSDYQYPAFTKTHPSCTETYTNSILPVNTWITGVSDNAGDGSLVGWSTTDDTLVGLYTVTITADDATCPYYVTDVQASYTLDVKSLCYVTPITIDSLNAVFVSSALTQDVWEPSKDLTWSDGDVSISDLTVDCGAVGFSLENQDATALDATVFTATLSQTVGSTQTLSV